MWVCGRKKDRKFIFPTHYTSRDIITDMIHWHIKHICVMSLHECDLDDPSRLPLCTCVSVSRVKYTCAMCFLLWMRDLDCTSCFTTSHLQCVQYVCVCVLGWVAVWVGRCHWLVYSMTLTIQPAGIDLTSFGTVLERNKFKVATSRSNGLTVVQAPFTSA